MFLHIKCLKQFIAACCLSCIYFRCLLCGAIVAVSSFSRHGDAFREWSELISGLEERAA